MIATTPSGTNVEFNRAGAGPAVVVIAANFSASDAGYMDALTPRFTVVEVSPRGYRGSFRPSEDAEFRLEDLREDIEAAADACEIQRFSVWGYSLTAGMALYVATTSTRVDALVAGGFPVVTPLAYQMTAAYFRNVWAAGPGDPDLPFRPATVLRYYEAMAEWLANADLSHLPARRIAYFGTKDSVLGMLDGFEDNVKRLRSHGFTVRAFDGLDHDACAGNRVEPVVAVVGEILLPPVHPR